MSLAIIETQRLCKVYGNGYAVKDLNLTVLPNRITAFLGLNGAGKSTTIRILLGMIRPSSGSGRVLGRDIDDPFQSVEIRRAVAYVSEDKRLYNYMTVEQMVRFTSGFFPSVRVAHPVKATHATIPARAHRSSAREFRNVLRKIRKIQARKFVPGVKEENACSALA